MKKAICFISILAMACIASAELDTATVTFDPLSSGGETNVLNVSGEVVSIGIRSSTNTAFTISITDYSTGAVIYSGSALTSTSLNLYPLIAATGTDGSTLTNTLGTIYIPANVYKMRIIASGSTNDTLTVATVVDTTP